MNQQTFLDKATGFLELIIAVEIILCLIAMILWGISVVYVIEMGRNVMIQNCSGNMTCYV